MDSDAANDILHFSACLPRNDFCTAEPQTIIYSSAQRPKVHDAKVKASLRDDPKREPPTMPPTFAPPKRSLAPMTDLEEFVKRFQTFFTTKARVETSRPRSSPSQPDGDDDRMSGRHYYNVYLHGPRAYVQRGRGDILQQLRLHVCPPAETAS